MESVEIIFDNISKGITGGCDDETDESLRARLYEHIKAAGSGCINDYIKWAHEVDGVGSVRVIPCADGIGTATVLITGSEFTPPTEELISKVQTHIDEVKPIGAIILVKASEFSNIDISVKISKSVNAVENDINALLNKRLENYLLNKLKNSLENITIKFSEIGSIIINTEGVIDYSELKINNGIQNVTIEAGKIPKLSEVVPIYE